MFLLFQNLLTLFTNKVQQTMDKVSTKGNDKTNARPESAQNNENVTILKDCENEQEKNSGTQRQFKR